MTGNTENNGWRRYMALLLFPATTLLVFAWIHRRILTYVSGQDPMTYVSLARRILGLSGEHTALSDTLSVVAPGYPLLLALGIWLFGPLAPYWMPLPMAVAAAWLLRSLLRRLGVAPGAATLILLGLLYFVLSSFALNIHFLLYPFRELPAFVALLAALNVFFAAVQGEEDRPTLLCASSVLFLLAALIREPSILVVAGPLTYLLLRRAAPQRSRLVSVAWFACPVILAVLGVGLVSLVLKMNLNAQFQKWMSFIVTSKLDVLLDRFAVHGQTMLGYLGEQVSIPVACFIVIGLWAMRRQGGFLCAFAIPAVLLFAFYSFTEGHRRYLLSSTLFMAVFLGAGVHWLAAQITTRLPERSVIFRAFPHWVAVCVFATGIIVEARALQPWGPRVLRHQVGRFQRTIQQVVPPGGRVFVHPHSRYVVDALVSFTSARVAVVDPKMARKAMDVPWHYIAPDDDTGYYPDGYFPYNGVIPEQILAYYFDYPLAGGVSGQAAAFVLGKSGYKIRAITAKRSDTALQDLSFNATSNGVTLWLDFGFAPSGTVADVTVGEASFAIAKAVGIQGVHLSAGSSTSIVHRVRVTARGGPLPRFPVLAAVADGVPLALDLMHDRSLSVHGMFGAPFPHPSSAAKYAGVLERGGVLDLPVPVGVREGRMGVAFLLSPRAPFDQTVNLTFSCLTRESLVPFSMKSGGWVGLNDISVPTNSSEARLVISVDPALSSGNPLRMHRMLLTVEEPTSSGGGMP